MELGEPFNRVIYNLVNQFGMDGTEAIQKLLKIDANIKGIVSTGCSNVPVVTKFWVYGFRSALTKPYTIDELSRDYIRLFQGNKNNSVLTQIEILSLKCIPRY